MNLKLVVFSMLLTSSTLAFAGQANDLFVIDGDQKLSVSQLLEDGTDVQANYDFDSFCYEGNPDIVLRKIKEFKATGNFFSGGGGGFEYISGQVNRGIVTYDLQLKFEDEVAQGEFQTVLVKPCSAK